MKRYSRWISCFPVGGFDSQSIVEKKGKEDAPGRTNKNRPREGRLLDRCRNSVFKLRHGLQFILGGVIHRVIGIPMLTGAGCGGCRGSGCSTGGGSRGAVWSGS